MSNTALVKHNDDDSFGVLEGAAISALVGFGIGVVLNVLSKVFDGNNEEYQPPSIGKMTITFAAIGTTLSILDKYDSLP